MKKFYYIVSLFLVSIFLLTSCGTGNNSTDSGSNSGSNESTGSTESSEANGSKKDTLNLVNYETFITMDPHNQTLTMDMLASNQIYETLLFCDDDNTFKEVLAEKYTISDDGLNYTFNLKKGVKFTNGEELKADDVIFSIKRCQQSPYMMAAVEAVETCEKVDDYTVNIKLKYASAPFLLNVSSVGIVNEKQCTAAGDKFGWETCGTGPYMLDKNEENVSLSLKSNPDYRDGEPSIKHVNWKIITDASTALISFEAGELDVIDVPTANWEEIKSKDNWSTITKETTHVAFVDINNEFKPLDNKLVRQAISYAIDRENMVTIARDGFAYPTDQIVTKYTFGFSDDYQKYTYNPEKAKELLKEAGYPDGFELPAIITISSYFEKMATVLQANLADIGIKTNVEMREASSYIDDIQKGNYSLAIMGNNFSTDFDSLETFYASKYINSNNHARYSNKEVDDLFQKGKQSVNPEERKEIYKKITQIVLDEVPYAACFNRTTGLAFDKNLNYKYHLNTAFYKECNWK